MMKSEKGFLTHFLAATNSFQLVVISPNSDCSMADQRVLVAYLEHKAIPKWRVIVVGESYRNAIAIVV